MTISRRGANRIRSGHVWVYRSDLVHSEGLASGALVEVREASGKHSPASDRSGRHPRSLGTAFYSSSSEIALRLLSHRRVDDLAALVRERIRNAIAYRERVVTNSNAYRVTFSEGDFLPGLIVDRYNDVLSLQVLTQAMDSEQIRQIVVPELIGTLTPAAIVERVDQRVRRLEQLPEKETGIIWSKASVQPSATARDAGETDVPPVAAARQAELPPQQQLATEFQMNGVKFLFDPLHGQKTGAFLDQRENYAAAAQYARGDALDAFCYQGGFALHLARVCSNVTGVDSSRPALEIADRNATLNRCQIGWIEANAFDLLRDYADAGRQYDTIVLDPPAFAKTRRDVPSALRAYKELNLRALKMLRPAGILVSCSCSFHVSRSDLEAVLASAALDSHRNIRVLENRGQAKDHPIILGIPETDYLKCIVIGV